MTVRFRYTEVMNKTQLAQLSKDAIVRALALAGDDEEKAIEILAKPVSETPTGPSGKYTFHWQVRAVQNQLAYIEVLENTEEANDNGVGPEWIRSGEVNLEKELEF